DGHAPGRGFWRLRKVRHPEIAQRDLKRTSLNHSALVEVTEDIVHHFELARQHRASIRRAGEHRFLELPSTCASETRPDRQIQSSIDPALQLRNSMMRSGCLERHPVRCHGYRRTLLNEWVATRHAVIAYEHRNLVKEL